MHEDLSLAGPGSPASLKKFLLKYNTNKPFTFIVDGSGQGIAKDAEDVIYITPEECSKQALYYCKDVFDGRRVPAYLFRYINYMMFDDERWKTDEDVANAFINQKLNESSEEYVRVKNFLTHLEHNTEGLQVVGLIQLISATLNIARKNKAGVCIYIDRPETALHPKRQSRFASMLIKIQKEYGYDEVQPEHDLDGDQK